MDSNPVKAKIAQGQASVGTWSTTGDASVIEVMAHMTELDWITIDFEHNAIDVSTAVNCLRAAQGSGKPMFARVPYTDRVWIKRVLDIGFTGIVVPDVQNAKQAREVVSAAKYAPDGMRGIGSARGQIAFGTDFYKKANDITMVVIMIEDKSAVEQIDEIMSVEGIDVCFIGPNDLAQSLGVPIGLDNNHPEHVAAVQKVVDAGKRHGVATGCHTSSGEEAGRRIKQGMQWFPISSDSGLLKSGIEAALANKDKSLEKDSDETNKDSKTFY
tara:strand:- start:569 stop:1381 length:813 start_codon:yes stop_codon:yes gene_type:complete